MHRRASFSWPDDQNGNFRATNQLVCDTAQPGPADTSTAVSSDHHEIGPELADVAGKRLRHGYSPEHGRGNRPPQLLSKTSGYRFQVIAIGLLHGELELGVATLLHHQDRLMDQHQFELRARALGDGLREGDRLLGERRSVEGQDDGSNGAGHEPRHLVACLSQLNWAEMGQYR